MKQIILVRHSRAEKPKSGREDSRRSLTKKGRKLATALSVAVKKAGFAPELIWTSPAARAKETARIFGKSLKYDPEKLGEKPEFYSITDGEVFLEMLKTLDDDLASVMFVGHEPAFNNFAALLAPAFNHQMTSPCVVVIEINKKSWKQITPASGSLKSVLFPMDKAGRTRYRKTVRKTLREAMIPQLTPIFEGFHPPSKKLSKLIKKQSKDLVAALLALEKHRSMLTEAEITAALNELKPREATEPEIKPQEAVASTPVSSEIKIVEPDSVAKKPVRKVTKVSRNQDETTEKSPE